MTLMHNGGLDTSLMVAMLNALPVDAKIVGFSEDHSWGTCGVFVTSKHFKEIPEGSRPCEITAMFNGSYEDGVYIVKFEKLDMSEAIDQDQGCLHEWKIYNGIMDNFKYCEKCQQKENS